jgi:uncharacterized repeat protein (TIGR03803 family)
MKPLLALLMLLLWAGVLALPVSAQSGAVLTNLYSFTGGDDGETPQCGLVQGSDGNFYGTTSEGGTNGWGTVFKISTNRVLTSLYSFTGENDGATPMAGLVQGSDGNCYGTTEYGGTNGWGTVFKINTNGVLTSLYSFGSIMGPDGVTLDGAHPLAGLLQGRDGYFYGTTAGGGGMSGGYGSVFRISAEGALTNLYSFTGGTDGGGPQCGLVQGKDGNFYGTTEYGGTNGAGTVFKVTASGVLTTLHLFTGSDGANPMAGLVQGSDGNFYGTTEYGGTNGAGTVFNISTNGALTSLYSFTGGEDGGNPVCGLVQGSDSYFYGTTANGGSDYYTDGTVFKISTNGVLTPLHLFTGGHDDQSPSGLVRGSDGNFYGTTPGSLGNPWPTSYGTVFKISANGVLTTLYAFTGGSHGGVPNGLVQGKDGNFYGTTEYGGTNGAGTVFKIAANGAMTTLYSFSGGTDGANPCAVLVQGSDGNFYGTTGYGGPNGCGTVFTISTNGALTSLYSFTGSNDGGNPLAGLVQGSDGSFYGTTYCGGTTNTDPYFDALSGIYGNGTVFKVTASGVLTTLHLFTGSDGANPRAGLVQGSDGAFYGATDHGGMFLIGGTLFRISTNGVLTSLYSFYGVAFPNALVQGRDGCFYGTTAEQGTQQHHYGTVFKITANGELTTLYNFGTILDLYGDPLDGANPKAGLVQGRDGAFYGTTADQGTNGAGTVFTITTNGVLSSLYSFTGSDGANPAAALVQGSDGYFYGTTFNGGECGVGTVFRLIVGLAFQAVTVTDGLLNLTWTTDPGKTYQLQFNSDLSSTNWANLDSIVTATGATLSATDWATNRTRFYRVVLSP